MVRPAAVLPRRRGSVGRELSAREPSSGATDSRHSRQLRGFARKDAATGDSERLERDLARVDAAAEKMLGLLEDLLELSRVGLLVDRPEDVAFGEIVDEALELVTGTVCERGVEVEVASDLPVVHGDRARLVEALQNLLENAVRYMGRQASPRIEIGRRRDESEQVLFVRDNGIGIDPEYHGKIFELFERLDPGGTKGTGVGLALVQRIIGAHGGRIWVESEGEGRGSTFCFTLPGETGEVGDAGTAERVESSADPG